MKNILRFLFSLIIISGSMLSVYATEIPTPITNYIKAFFPAATIRFDGLVELPDGTQYLPVIPINIAEVPDPSKVVASIPENADMSSKPDLLLFANNFSLLKVIRKPGQNPTIVSSYNIPFQVKLGILPQDLVVPENLVIPTELRIILGDLKIPVKGEQYKTISQISSSKSGKNPIKKINHNIKKVVSVKVAEPEKGDLINKTLYASNFQSNLVYIIDAKTGKPKKVIELSSVPSDIAKTDDGRYVLATCLSSDKVSVIDTATTNFVKDIQVGQLPISIVVARGENTAYIANRASSSISVINLKDMKFNREIKIKGIPVNLTISDDNRTLFYNDSITGIIYSLDIVDEQVDQITQAYNISKLYQHENYLFILCRMDNKLLIYDLDKDKLIKTLEVGNKPVDMLHLKDKNKIYILSAGSDTLSSLDLNTLEITKTIVLGNGGFPRSINLIEFENMAIISNLDSYELMLFDFDQEKVITTIPVNTGINSLSIISNNNKL